MHTMSMIRKHEGIEEWLCPTCGRHMLVNWYPKFKRTVLNAGDSLAGHSAFKSDIKPDDLANGASKPKETHLSVDESRLAPWTIWMDKSDFADRWDNNVQ